MTQTMQLISVIYRLYQSYQSPSKISVSNIGQNISTDIIGDIDRYNRYLTDSWTDITDISPIFDRYNRDITDISLNYYC
ncbi:hypothetical protein HanRHA438_Chr13g0623651 [Helianthus annuus]|nr:hypothetical protein HanRHA438_Chr13g0623651 [Helianthus annuus]